MRLIVKMEETMIEFDKARLKRLKTAYDLTIEKKQKSFIFEGRELLVSYAKYMIEYLEGRLK